MYLKMCECLLEKLLLLVVSQNPLNGGTMDFRLHRKNISNGTPTKMRKRSEKAKLARK
jgi:hypothetical protein